jgi:hypothetical protein
MLPEGDRRPVTVSSACMRPDGLPDFALPQVEVTHAQAENGLHLYFAEAELLRAGHEEPLVHFPSGEAPALLLPAVRAYLAARPADTATPGAR